MKLFLVLLAMPLAGFSQLSMGGCADYSSKLTSYCAENSCSSVSELESALSSSGTAISSLTPECQASAYKSMTNVLGTLLSDSESEKEKALALAKKRKTLSTILGVTTGVAAAGAIGLGIAYKNEKNNNTPTEKKASKDATETTKPDAKEPCTDEQLREISSYSLIQFIEKLPEGATEAGAGLINKITQEIADDIDKLKFENCAVKE